MNTGMIKALVCCLALSCTTACAWRQSATMDKQDEVEAIAASLDDFHAAASEADEQRYFDHFTPDGVFIGTDATERWDVAQFRAYAHPHFSKGRGWTYAPRDRHIQLLDSTGVALFDEKLDHAQYGEL